MLQRTSFHGSVPSLSPRLWDGYTPVDREKGKSYVLSLITMKKLALCVLSLVSSSLLLADPPSSIDTPLNDGGLVVSKSFKTNLVVYSSIGGRTDVKGKEQKRKWWCLWLCKRRVDKKAERITISNTYFSEVTPGVFAVLERDPKICNNASSCEQKEWAAGVGIKLQFPEGGTTPTTVGGLLPVDGVITKHEILVDGQLISAVTSVGKHPSTPILQ
jgi:hypothetical protein